MLFVLENPISNFNVKLGRIKETHGTGNSNAWQHYKLG